MCPSSRSRADMCPFSLHCAGPTCTRRSLTRPCPCQTHTCPRRQARSASCRLLSLKPPQRLHIGAAPPTSAQTSLQRALRRAPPRPSPTIAPGRMIFHPQRLTSRIKARKSGMNTLNQPPARIPAPCCTPYFKLTSIPLSQTCKSPGVSGSTARSHPPCCIPLFPCTPSQRVPAAPFSSYSARGGPPSFRTYTPPSSLPLRLSSLSLSPSRRRHKGSACRQL